MKTLLPVLALIVASGCVPQVDETDAAQSTPSPTPTVTPIASSPPPRVAVPVPAVFSQLDGQFTQGGYIRGIAPVGTRSLTLGDETVPVAEDRQFFAAFDRDSVGSARLVALLDDGRRITEPVEVSPREWQLERIDLARPTGGARESFMVRRRPELARITSARQVRSDIDGWRQDFVWPASGRISGRFGSQRIYRGVPGSYHSGIDIATGETDTPFVAPADGVVVLASPEGFSLEGKLLIIDHGNGLNSAFLHASELAVTEGQIVRQGQYIGRIGSTGSATGPHLHWSLKWGASRLDPILFTGPM